MAPCSKLQKYAENSLQWAVLLGADGNLNILEENNFFSILDFVKPKADTWLITPPV